MKVIDLLNKIANGEEVPKKFRFANQTFEKQGSHIEDEDGDSIFYSMCVDFSNINDEIEIIEEDKEIEKLDLNYKDIIYGTDFKEQILSYCDNLQYKINELIKEVNKLKNKLF